MTRAELAAFKRLDKRRDTLFLRIGIIHTWIMSPWCAQSAEELVAMIAKLTTQTIKEEREAQRKENERSNA